LYIKKYSLTDNTFTRCLHYLDTHFFAIGIHGRQMFLERDQLVVFCERHRKSAGMPSPVPLQEGGMWTIPDRIPVLCYDVADSEEEAGNIRSIPRHTAQRRKIPTETHCESGP